MSLPTGVRVTRGALATAGVVATGAGEVKLAAGAPAPRGGSVAVRVGVDAPARGAVSTRVAGAGFEAKRKSAESVGTAIAGSLATVVAVGAAAELNVFPGIGVMSAWGAAPHGVAEGTGVAAGAAPP